MVRPTLRQLEYLIALEEEKSFSRAAEICGATQSTLSSGIRDLENILEQNLVVRGRKNISLTAFGEEVVFRARKILRETDQITARALAIKSPLTGPLRMGVIPTIAPYFLPKILPLLKDKFPSLELQLYEDLSDRILKKLQQGSLDIVLMAFPFETPHMKQKFLFEESFYFACYKSLYEKSYKGRRSISSSDLDIENLLLLDDGHCLRDHAIEACGLPKYDKEKKSDYGATSLLTLIQMVNNGYGTTLLPEMVVKNHMLPSDIYILKFKDLNPKRIIGLAWREFHPRDDEFETLGSVMIDGCG